MSETADDRRMTARLRVLSRMDQMERERAYGRIELVYVRGRLVQITTTRNERVTPEAHEPAA